MNDEDTTAEPGGTESKESGTPFGSDPQSESEEEHDKVERKVSRFDRIPGVPDAGREVAETFRSMREGLRDFFVSMDRGGERRTAETTEHLNLIRDDLERGDLSPEERMERLKMAERAFQSRGEEEKDVRVAGGANLQKMLAVGGVVVLGAAGLAYAAKTGKLPGPPTAGA